jgi:hypothetical protein
MSGHHSCVWFHVRIKKCHTISFATNCCIVDFLNNLMPFRSAQHRSSHSTKAIIAVTNHVTKHVSGPLRGISKAAPSRELQQRSTVSRFGSQSTAVPGFQVGNPNLSRFLI